MWSSKMDLDMDLDADRSECIHAIRYIHIHVTLLSLKVDVPCKNCTCYKIMTMAFWTDWRSPTPLES
jgi:hypothetical protein